MDNLTTVEELQAFVQAESDKLRARGYTCVSISVRIATDEVLIAGYAYDMSSEYLSVECRADEPAELLAKWNEYVKTQLLDEEDFYKRKFVETVEKLGQIADKLGEPAYVSCAEMLRQHLRTNLLTHR